MSSRKIKTFLWSSVLKSSFISRWKVPGELLNSNRMASRSYISLQRKPWFWPLWATAIRSQGMPWTWIHQLLRGSVSSSRSIFRWPRFHLLILRLSSPAQVSDIGNSISASKYRSHSNYAGSLRLLAELERDGLPEAQEIWAASGLERALKMSN